MTQLSVVYWYLIIIMVSCITDLFLPDRYDRLGLYQWHVVVGAWCHNSFVIDIKVINSLCWLAFTPRDYPGNFPICYVWTRLVRTSDPGQWFGKIQGPVTRVQHLVQTNSYVNATVSSVRRYGAMACMKQRELIQDPDCTLALQHDPDLLTWASYPG